MTAPAGRPQLKGRPTSSHVGSTGQLIPVTSFLLRNECRETKWAGVTSRHCGLLVIDDFSPRMRSKRTADVQAPVV